MNFLDVNQNVNGYIVDSIISSNTFYETYLVKDENNTSYFLKIYDLAETPKELIYQNKEIFEFLNCMDLTHPNILEFIDKGKILATGKTYHYMVTKYYDGTKIEDFINQNGALSVAESINVIRKIIDAVSYMHNNGILHNKITPFNIIIDKDYSTTLIDLGYSSRNIINKCYTPCFSHKEYHYIANEALSGEFSKESDTFSIIALLYKLLTGNMLWDNIIVSDMNTDAIIKNRYDSPLKLDGKLDENLKKIIIKGVSINKSERFHTTNEILKALESIDDIDPLVSTKEQFKSSTKSLKKSKADDSFDIRKAKGNAFDDIAGMKTLKDSLKAKVLYWLKNKEQAHKYKITLPNGMLLYGPPGCGKTFFAEKFAEEAGFNFIMVKASDIASTYIHGTQEKIAKVFETAEKSRPSIICFDEFDAVVPERTSMMQQTSGEVNEFLSQMNNCNQRGIFIIATSNRPDKIDPAILRTGRIDKLVYIPIPDEEARYEMLQLYLKERPTDNIDYMKLAKETEGYIASDIAYIINDAAMKAGIQDIPINEDLIEASLKQTPPSIRPELIKEYEQVRNALQGTGINRRIPPIGFTTKQYME